MFLKYDNYDSIQLKTSKRLDCRMTVWTPATSAGQ